MSHFSTPSLIKRASVKSAALPLARRRTCAAGRPVKLVGFKVAEGAFYFEAAKIQGVPQSLAAIDEVCFAGSVPPSFSGLQERFDFRGGSISHGLRVFLDGNASQVLLAPALKRAMLKPDIELQKLTAHDVEQRVKEPLDSGRGRSKVIGNAVPAGPSVASRDLRVSSSRYQGGMTRADRCSQ